MATTLWRRQFCPAHVRLIQGAELTMDANGRPRIGLPLGETEDVIVEFCMGILADLRTDLPLKLRARCWAVPTTHSYQLGAKIMAQSAGDGAEVESFSTTETESSVVNLPATSKALHDVEIDVPVGVAQDNAQPDDTVYLRLALKPDDRATTDRLYVTLTEAWQETE